MTGQISHRAQTTLSSDQYCPELSLIQSLVIKRVGSQILLSMKAQGNMDSMTKSFGPYDWFDQSFADLTSHSLKFFTYVGHRYLVSIANLATILAIGRSCTEPSLDTMDTRHSAHGWPTPAGKQDQHQDCTSSSVKLDWVLMRHIVYFERMENVRDDFICFRWHNVCNMIVKDRTQWFLIL